MYFCGYCIVQTELNTMVFFFFFGQNRRHGLPYNANKHSTNPTVTLDVLKICISFVKKCFKHLNETRLFVYSNIFTHSIGSTGLLIKFFHKKKKKKSKRIPENYTTEPNNRRYGLTICYDICHEIIT